MKRLTIPLGLALGLGAGLAGAQTMPTDTDGNGSYSMAEMQATWADLTEDVFKSIDTDANGEVDGDELKAAMDAGVLK
ncbi:EF-hand domain-containing protein [Frigidibacter sp. SD6-1]|uniref:EF-hand domain-containing protein n=1 Tax=Frigidibacter sp. SD6-1 TaxID=3032581 RepID=UPI0024E03604|nr:EF-hand domain-containing protein [Frigidibacter sp. SD6-1]